jgi:hypothetical protein
MKNLILIGLIVLSLNLFGQGLGIESQFYSSNVPEMKTWDDIKKYWEKEIQNLNVKIKSDKNNPELIYKLVVAKHNSGEQNLVELIKQLDKAISINPNRPKYYAVRGIIKYNWGAWSPDYDIGEGCPDVKKAIKMGLSKNLKSSESIVGVLEHPSCK